MKSWWRRVRPHIISGVVYWIASLLGRTVKLKIVGYEKTKDLRVGKIYAGWHGTTLLPALFWRGQGVWTLISQSRDGEIQNRIFKKLGFNTIRGSTGRGGARAAVEAIRVLRDGGTMAFTPDGPRGPSGVVQGGVLLMAQKSGAAIIPVGVSARPRWLVGTWDKYLVPKPFARAILVFRDPVAVPADADEQELERIRRGLQEEINAAEAEAEAALGFPALPRVPTYEGGADAH